MERWEMEVVFSKSFPKISLDELDALDEKILKILKNDPQIEKTASMSAQEILDHYMGKYTYVPRPGADRRIKKAVSLAIEICEHYRMDTTISKGMYLVEISMDIGYGLFEEYIKAALEKLMGLSDNISFSACEDDADALIISMSYYTHDHCYAGKKV